MKVIGHGTFGIALRWKHKKNAQEEWVDEVVKIPIYKFATKDENEIIKHMCEEAEQTRKETAAHRAAAKTHICEFPRNCALGPVLCIISPYAGEFIGS